MAHWVYVLYSRELDQFHVGENEDVDLRVDQHNDHFFRGAFTQKASDWILRTTLQCRDRTHARAIEGYIKKQKRRTFVERITLEVMKNRITELAH